MREISIAAWDAVNVSQILASEVPSLSYVVLRTFARVTYDDVDMHGNKIEVDSLKVFRETGTDRRSNAQMWNVRHFDHEHDRDPRGKRPEDIIYGFLVDRTVTPCRYSLADGEGSWSWQPINKVTDPLLEDDVIAIYDYQLLERAAPNEYWFKSTPFEAALLLIVPEIAP